MTTLAELFDTRGPAPVAEDRAVPPAESLTRMFGSPGASSRRPLGASVAVADDSEALRQIVGERTTSVTVGAPAPAPTRLRRVRGAKDWLSIGLAIIAVLALVAAATLFATRLAAASPAEGAMSTLRESEAVLVDAQEALSRGIASATSVRDDAVASATALGPTLSALTGITDETARLAAETARQEYLTTMAALEIPDEPAPYRRPSIDETSLSSVGTAIDAVVEQTAALVPAQEQLAEARSAARAADEKLAAALAAYAAGIPAFAATIIAENPDAEATFGQAVATAAAALGASDLRAPAAGAAIGAYATAIVALRADQERAAAAARESELNNGGNTGGGNSGGNTGGGTGGETGGGETGGGETGGGETGGGETGGGETGGGETGGGETGGGDPGEGGVVG